MDRHVHFTLHNLIVKAIINTNFWESKTNINMFCFWNNVLHMNKMEYDNWKIRLLVDIYWHTC